MKNQSAPLPTSSTYMSFDIKEKRGANDSMIEFAKMTILFSFNEYPKDDIDKAEFIKKKFNEQYSKNWNCCFLKCGGISFHYFNYWIYIKYNDYDIHIWK